MTKYNQETLLFWVCASCIKTFKQVKMTHKHHVKWFVYMSKQITVYSTLYASSWP